MTPYHDPTFKEWFTALVGALWAITLGVTVLLLVIGLLPVVGYSALSYLVHRGR